MSRRGVEEMGTSESSSDLSGHEPPLGNVPLRNIRAGERRRIAEDLMGSSEESYEEEEGWTYTEESGEFEGAYVTGEPHRDARGYGAQGANAWLQGESTDDEQLPFAVNPKKPIQGYSVREAGRLVSQARNLDASINARLDDPERIAFSLMPQPLPPHEGGAAFRREEAALMSIPFSDPTLRSANDRIRGLTRYIQTVEEEEGQLIEDFRETMSTWVDDADARAAEERTTTAQFRTDLKAVRNRRYKLRGMLYDARQERRDVLKSHLLRSRQEARLQQKWEEWENKNGVDWFLYALFVVEIAMLICFLIFVDFPTASFDIAPNPTLGFVEYTTKVPLEEGGIQFVNANRLDGIGTDHRFFTHLSLFVFIGLNLWMCCMKIFTWGSIGLNFMLGTFAIQVGLLLHTFWLWAFQEDFEKILLTSELASELMYVAAAALVAHAAILGRVNEKQSIMMGGIGTLMYVINYNIIMDKVHTVDTGYQLRVFLFASVFGIVTSWVYSHDDGERTDAKHNRLQTYLGSPFALIGAAVLFVYFPSFNAALALPDLQPRILIVTMLTMSASVAMFAVFSILFTGGMSFHGLLASCVAGGVVSMGGQAAVFEMWQSLLVGAIAGALTQLFVAKLAAPLESKLHLFDSSNVLGAVLIPALLGSLITTHIAIAAKEGDNLSGFAWRRFYPEDDQAAERQLAGTAITLGMGIVGGLLTGLLLRFFKHPEAEHRYNADEELFHVSKDYGQF